MAIIFIAFCLIILFYFSPTLESETVDNDDKKPQVIETPQRPQQISDKLNSCIEDSLHIAGHSTWQALSIPPSGKATYWWKGSLIVLGIWNVETEKYVEQKIIKNRRIVLTGRVGVRNIRETDSKADVSGGTVYMDECA